MIKKTIDVDALNIEEIFDFEYKINKKINKIRKKQKQIDYIYLNYNKIKSKLDININQYKKLLIKINNKKEEYDMKSLSFKLQYLEKEYDFLIKQNNAKINTIKYLKKRILSILNDYKYNLNYDNFKKKLSKIDTKNSSIELPLKQKIKILEKKQEILLRNNIICDGYIFYLENLYNNTIKKRMLDITIK